MNESRREFIKKTGCALSMTALATQMHHLGMVSALAQKMEEKVDTTSTTEGGENYKALVLVYFAGGNDGNNMVIPNHSSSSVSNYAAYAAARQPQGLAIPQADLLPISVPRMGGLTYGLHPALGPVTGGTNNGIHELWGLGKLAVVSNCGTLIRPMTKAQYQNGSIQKPYQLFSHSDQVYQTHTSISNTQAFTGWGGRIADRLTQGSNPTGLIPMITSISGAQLFTAGQTTLPMAIANANTSLANVLNPTGFNSTAASTARRNAFNQLRTIDLDSNYVAAASHVTDLAMQANAALQTSQEVTVTFPNTSMGLQLKQVARLIKKRLDLNINRQIFYVQIGGFDTHNNQLGGHVTLLSQFSQAVRAFYDEMVVQGVSNDVTVFTLTDFNRTFNPAGSGATVGSDHAWGNHMFVIGGSVAGGDFYGMNTSNGTPFPTLVIGASGPDDTDSGSGARGRWIPTTSVDQYAATLARWFGLPENQMSQVFPNIANFSTSNLGFMI
ncbi:DUF1501 domain-containing protein [Leptolyngbya sp. 7M]|uniref:DUF1501 domain-containing protein n=1 Tax=Leptolyngbya sp. 7M TaxID=2812896 RepID=UPI001B8D763E|nr:DUF1501 domain-containing protein [Leptolyngbya sp. 7M]QYO65730.1 DUF1501 domain-containing protein [Leptolyngbya sp. 7M]